MTSNVPEETPIDPQGFIGVDLGIKNVATTSDGKLFCGKSLEEKRTRYLKLRTALQKKGTKSAKRHLKRISKKESNFRKDTNHCISKQIVETAKDTGRGISLEKLENIRDRVTVRKSQRAQIASWSFFQLQTFIEYKAQRDGIPVVYIDPAYTSRECHACGHVDKAN